MKLDNCKNVDYHGFIHPYCDMYRYTDVNVGET